MVRGKRRRLVLKFHIIKFIINPVTLRADRIYFITKFCCLQIIHKISEIQIVCMYRHVKRIIKLNGKELVHMDSLNVEGIRNMNDEIFVEVNDKLYDRYNQHIRKIVTRILTNAGQAGYIDDCVNTVFLQLMERLWQYNETRGSMAAFITIITRSVALNYCKGNMRKIGELIGDDNIDFLTEPVNFESEIEYEMLVKSIIEKLNKQESVLFTMRFILFYSPEEIAKTFKITRNTVDGRINSLKNKIKRFLKKGGVTL